MSDVLKSNPTALRHCILFEALQRTPIEETYSKFCRTLGNDFMEYREFDFWYYRFLNGDYDLNYELDKNKKNQELSNMPIDVMEEIVEHLDIFDRLVVRNVSRDLRALIDKRTDSVKRIGFQISSDSFFVFIDNIHTEYKESEESETSQNNHNEYNGVLCSFQKMHRTYIEGPDVMNNALKHLAYYLRNPKLKLEYFSIVDRNDDEECFEKLEALLLSLEHQISTETFDYTCVSEYFFLAALKSFKPGVLEVMRGEAYWYRYEDYEVMDEIVGTEQWKQAKRLILRGTMPVIVDEVAHFEEFAMVWDETEPENVVRLKQLLLESKTFKKGELTFSNRRTRDLKAAIDRIVQALGTRMFRDPENPLKWSYPIPDTNEFLNFYQDRTDGFSIERTT